MPSGRVHFVAGALSSALVLHEFHCPLEYMMAGAMAAMIPDSDLKQTTAGCLLPMWIFCKHRGFTHSFTALTLITFLTAYMNDYLGVAVFVGYLSHIVLDWLTPRGVQLNWPKKKYYSLRR